MNGKKMMIKRDLQNELNQIKEDFKKIHVAYEDNTISHDKYIFLVIEHNAIVSAYQRVLDAPRPKTQKQNNNFKKI